MRASFLPVIYLLSIYLSLAKSARVAAILRNCGTSMLANALAANGTLLCASRLPPTGVECHRGHVRSLTIRSAGTLPTELGRLPALQSLTIAAPSLMGTLPTQLGSLATLQQLKAVRSDRLSGTLPPRLGGVCGTEAPPMAAHNAWGDCQHHTRLGTAGVSIALPMRLHC